MSCGTLVPATAFSFSLTRLLRSLAPLSNGVQLTITSVYAGPQPRGACSSVWAVPSSLAATMGIDLSFSSSGYLDVSVPRVPSACAMYLRMDVLLRRLVPWHPPCALLRLITSILRLVTFTSGYSLTFLIATGLSRLFLVFLPCAVVKVRG